MILFCLVRLYRPRTQGDEAMSQADMTISSDCRRRPIARGTVDPPAAKAGSGGWGLQQSTRCNWNLQTGDPRSHASIVASSSSPSASASSPGGGDWPIDWARSAAPGIESRSVAGLCGEQRGDVPPLRASGLTCCLSQSSDSQTAANVERNDGWRR